MAQVFVFAEGTSPNAAAIEDGLRAAGELTQTSVTRGLGSVAAKALAWVLEFTGDTSKVADQLWQGARICGRGREASRSV